MDGEREMQGMQEGVDACPEKCMVSKGRNEMLRRGRTRGESGKARRSGVPNTSEFL